MRKNDEFFWQRLECYDDYQARVLESSLNLVRKALIPPPGHILNLTWLSCLTVARQNSHLNNPDTNLNCKTNPHAKPNPP